MKTNMNSKKRQKHKGTAKKPRKYRVDCFSKLTDPGKYKIVFNPESGLELQNEAGEILSISN